MFSVSRVILFLWDKFFLQRWKRKDWLSILVHLNGQNTHKCYFIFMYSICIVLVSKQDPHRIMQSQKIQAGKEFSNPTSCLQQNHFWGPVWFLRTVSSCVLKTSRIGNYTVSFPPPLQVEEGSPYASMNTCCFNLGLFSLFLLPCTAVKGLTPSPQ